MTESTAEAPPSGAGPLAGIRVLDFSRVLAGPHCTRMLADLGADVIKVEPPAGGDLSRSIPPRSGRTSMFFLTQNCGKRNVSIDLEHPDGRDLAARLAECADIVVENFRPGVMDRFDLGYERLSQLNERLVYASISGYGQSGPWRHRKAFAPMIHAEMGLTHLHARRFGESKPFEVFSHADVYTGLECLGGILAALYQREHTGRGQHVDVAMAATMLLVNERTSAEVEFDLEKSPGQEAIVVAETSSGHRIVIMGEPTSDFIFRQYIHVMGRPSLAHDPRFATPRERRAHRDDLVDIIRTWVLSFDDVAELERVLDEMRMPMGTIRSIRDAADTEWARDWGAFADVDDRFGSSVRIPQAPWKFSRASAEIRGSAAHPGEDNETVLADVLGLGADDVERLKERGVLHDRIPDEESEQHG